MPRRFLLTFFAVFLSLTAIFAGVTALADPYYHYHGPIAGLPLWLEDGRYQSVGAAENLDYENILLGTSVTANFDASQFDDALPGRTQKLILLGGYFSEFFRPLDRALETHDVQQIFWGVDANCWRRLDAENTWEEPEYLFDKNPWNDVRYLLNKDTFFWYIPDIIRAARTGDYDESAGGFTWGGDQVWSRETALAVYQRPEKTEEKQPPNSLLPAARENLENVLARVEANPQITFTFFLAPYSILSWDKLDREGELEAMLVMQEEVLTALTAQPNARVFYFMDDLELITNLDNYCDEVHYSQTVCRELARRLLEEEPLRPEEVGPRLEAFGAFLAGYDFDSLFRQS